MSKFSFNPFSIYQKNSDYIYENDKINETQIYIVDGHTMNEIIDSKKINNVNIRSVNELEISEFLDKNSNNNINIIQT